MFHRSDTGCWRMEALLQRTRASLTSSISAFVKMCSSNTEQRRMDVASCFDLGCREYSSMFRVIYVENYWSNFSYSVSRYFLFPIANFHFRLQFLQSVGELLEFMETWGFAILFVHWPALK